MKNGLEFFNASQGKVAIQDNNSIYYLEQKDIAIIETILEETKKYVGTYERLQQVYQSSIMNSNYYNYRMALRFCRCNCGKLDNLSKDIDEDGHFHLEEVECPLRGTGDCLDEGIICLPRRQSILTEREREITELLKTKTLEEIAESLSLSMRTVYNHIQSIKKKTMLSTVAQIATLALV